MLLVTDKNPVSVPLCLCPLRHYRLPLTSKSVVHLTWCPRHCFTLTLILLVFPPLLLCIKATFRSPSSSPSPLHFTSEPSRRVLFCWPSPNADDTQRFITFSPNALSLLDVVNMISECMPPPTFSASILPKQLIIRGLLPDQIKTSKNIPTTYIPTTVRLSISTPIPLFTILASDLSTSLLLWSHTIAYYCFYCFHLYWSLRSLLL